MEKGNLNTDEKYYQLPSSSFVKKDIISSYVVPFVSYIVWDSSFSGFTWKNVNENQRDRPSRKVRCNVSWTCNWSDPGVLAVMSFSRSLIMLHSCSNELAVVSITSRLLQPVLPILFIAIESLLIFLLLEINVSSTSVFCFDSKSLIEKDFFTGGFP